MTDETVVEGRVWTLTLPWTAPPLTLNQRLHWARRAALSRQVRDAAQLLASQARLPHGLAVVEVELHWRPATVRRRDSDNPFPTLKAAIDGLTAYGLTEDDDSSHVSSRCVIEPVGKPACLWLTIRETP